MDTQVREESRCRLAAEALRSWGTLKVRARGVSMLPTLWPGDVITIQSVLPEQVEPGEIVLYMRQGRFFIHRIVSCDLSSDTAILVTRGDCILENDPPVGRSELLGKVVEVRRSGSTFMPAPKLSAFRRRLARWLCRGSILRQVGLRLWNYRHPNDGDPKVPFVNAA